MIIAVDFDMTISDASGALLTGAKETINQLRADGHTVIIWTSRTGNRLTDAVDYLKENGIEYDHVNENIPGIKDNPRKVIADIYVDDKNLGGFPGWEATCKALTREKNTMAMKDKAFVQGMVRQFDRKAAEESRTVEFVISDETRDRHGTVIPIGAWQLENFNKNGIAGYQHDVYGNYDPDPDKILGVAKAWVEGDQLIGSITFEPADVNPFAEKLFRKVLNGTLKAVSVGFRELAPGKWGEGEQSVNGKNPTYYFGSVELLEFSIVNIPSNPNALRRKMEESEVDGLRKQLQESYDENFRLLAQLTAQGQEIDTLNKTVEYYRNKSRRG